MLAWGAQVPLQQIALSFSLCNHCHFLKHLAPDQIIGVGSEDVELISSVQCRSNDAWSIAAAVPSLVDDQGERNEENRHDLHEDCRDELSLGELGKHR